MPSPDPERSPALPATVGRYRVLGLLGQGGMGVVYEAEQTNPRRRVAVKVIRGGQTVDEHRIRMFEREAQTLALLEHPNIGAIYEAGRTDDGHHFFAMELVRGKTLDEWRRGRPSIGTPGELRVRLALFRKIADAVHYAHRRGVIHRDLKPSNVLVGEEVETGDRSSSGTAARLPAVKVLDFGLARITDGDIALASLTTDVGVIKGTLAYMSPEQARANPAEIDSRTDVYALGVILFELLSGERPYDLTARSLPDAVRVICEEPPRRLTGRRGAEADLARVAGRESAAELETIVGKALAKEAEGRYESAAALSDDVLRYLTQQPILARPPSTLYQLRKFAARNRALVGGVVATFVALVAGVVVSTVLALREAKQKRAAEAARADLQTVVDFQAAMLRRVEPDRMGHTLMEDLQRRVTELGERGSASLEEVASALGVLDAVNGATTGLHLIGTEILAPAAAALEAQAELDPAVAARLHHTLASAYRHLGLYDGAVEENQRAVEILERGDDRAALLRARSDLAATWSLVGRDEEAENLLRATLDGQRRLPAPEADALSTMDELATVLAGVERYEEAIALHREALEGRRRLFGPDSVLAAQSERHLAYALSMAGEYGEAERLFRSGIARGRELLGEDDSSVLSAMANLAGSYEAQDRHDEAEALFREILEIRRRTMGEEHTTTLVAEHNLGSTFLNRGEPEEAERWYRPVLEKRRRVLGEQHPFTLMTLRNLALALWDQGRDDEVEPVFAEAIAGQRRVLGPSHPETVQTQGDFAYWLAGQGRHGEAERLFAELVEIQRERALGKVAYYAALSDLANESKSLGRKEEAEALYAEALEGLAELDPSRAAIVAYNLACLAAVNGETEKALERLRTAVEAGFDHAEHMRTDSELASLHGEREFEELVKLAAGE